MKIEGKSLPINQVFDALGPQRICITRDRRTFFLSNWAKFLEPNSNNLTTSTLQQSHPQKGKALTSQDLIHEIKAVAFTIL